VNAQDTIEECGAAVLELGYNREQARVSIRFGRPLTSTKTGDDSWQYTDIQILAMTRERERHTAIRRESTMTRRVYDHRRKTTGAFGCVVVLLFSCVLVFGAWPTAQAAEPGQKPSAAENSHFHQFSRRLPVGLTPDRFRIPADNPLTQDKVDLGRLLFFDKRLSADNTVACATCHSPEKAFADDIRLSIGINGRQGVRNAPTLINRIGGSEQFRDGRAATLEEQAKAPLINPVELGMPDYDAVVDKLQQIAEYRVLFETVFNRDVNIEDLARAIASFERTIVSWNSRWDKFITGDEALLTKSEMRGLIIFMGKGRCTQCHSGWNLADEKYHNIGIGWDSNMPDEGRFKVTNNDKDRGAFRTPTLRDVALTGPYMHDGRFDTLEQVVDYYSRGVIANPYLDVEMRRSSLSLEETLELYDEENRSGQKEFPVQRLDLTQQEASDLVAFMLTLAGEGWQDIGAPDSFPE